MFWKKNRKSTDESDKLKKDINEFNIQLINPNRIDVRIIDENILSEPGEKRVSYLEELVSKQLNLYNWCEEKVSTLATMDSILLGAATLVANHIIGVCESFSVNEIS